MAISRCNSYSTTPYSDISTSKTNSHNFYQHQEQKVKHPRNAVILNFSQGEKVTVDDVLRALDPFGSIRSVQLCTMDACQAFVTFQNNSQMSARRTVSNLLKKTRGILFVEEFMWTICRPEEWKKVMDIPMEKVEETNDSLVGKGITVDELTEIFTNFITQNSSMSQASLFSDSTQSFSSFSSLSLARSRSSSASSPYAESCDSSVTITPFSFYPAQQSSGFLNLPPPYHTLPDTAFFRRTKIVPPPPIKKETVSVTQSIMNCYIKSIQKGDSDSPRRRQTSSCSRMELECNWYNML